MGRWLSLLTAAVSSVAVVAFSQHLHGEFWRQRQQQPNSSPSEHRRRVRWDFATLVAVGNLLRLLAAPTKGVVLGRLLLPPSNLATTLSHFSRLSGGAR